MPSLPLALAEKVPSRRGSALASPARGRLSASARRAAASARASATATSGSGERPQHAYRARCEALLRTTDCRWRTR